MKRKYILLNDCFIAKSFKRKGKDTKKCLQQSSFQLATEGHTFLFEKIFGQILQLLWSYTFNKSKVL